MLHVKDGLVRVERVLLEPLFHLALVRPVRADEGDAVDLLREHFAGERFARQHLPGLFLVVEDAQGTVFIRHGLTAHVGGRMVIVVAEDEERRHRLAGRVLAAGKTELPGIGDVLQLHQRAKLADVAAVQHGIHALGRQVLEYPPQRLGGLRIVSHVRIAHHAKGHDRLGRRIGPCAAEAGPSRRKRG